MIENYKSNFSQDESEINSRGWAGIKYLNAYPLVRGLEEDFPHWRRYNGTPSECSSLLDRGKVDIALVPLVGAVLNNWPFLSDVGIACHGPVESVKLIFHTPLNKVETYKPDPASQTSNLMARLLYNLEFGRDILPNPRSEDAEIVIGDRAFEADTPDQIDLGKAWFDETGLPFVFGVWAARSDEILREVGPALIARMQANLRDRDLLIYGASRLTGKLINVKDYLYSKLHYQLGELDQLGINTFVDLAFKYGFLPTRKMRTISLEPIQTVEPQV